MNEAIKLAVEKGGYNHRFEYLIKRERWRMTILDPLFWQSLGKALKWDVEIDRQRCPIPCERAKGLNWVSADFCFGCGKPVEWYKTKTRNWKSYALNYFDLVLTGGDTEKFWEELLTSTK